METTSPDSQALPPGTHLHEFVIEKVLGAGGFGITYLARDTGLNRQVVIKENLPTQFAWRETSTGTVRPRHSSGGDADDYQWSMNNFLREAETLASLDHPGIVRVLRKFEANGTAYFVMPFVDGVALDTLIEDRRGKDKPFSEDELRGLLERVLAALAYLHDRGIYHRDIKPGNILISNDGVPALIDFGSARQRLSERSMTVVESAGYTPFEQLQSRGNVGPWSDLYALGATLVKAITFETVPKAADRIMGDPWRGLLANGKIAGHYSPAFLRSEPDPENQASG
jgi:serine/threonine protein kinase